MLSSMRVAIRSLMRRPAVPLVAVVSLAVGIGVNCAVFSVVDTMFLRPPAVSSPESLVTVSGAFKDSGGTVLDWQDCREMGELPAFSAVTATMGRGGLWRNGDEMTLLLSETVADNYFETLGLAPVLGRLPGAADAEGDPPIILSHWFWRERMGARPQAIGERMVFRDHLWRIAAVLPPDFRGLEPLGQRHVWITNSGWSRYWRGDLERNGGQYSAIARLRPGVSMEQAQSQLDGLSRRIEQTDSRVIKGRRLVAWSVGQQIRERWRPAALILFTVGLVLLIACANVAAILLAHAEARRREIGLRLSLGAGRMALARQFAAEGAVLAIAGAALGLLLTSWLLSLAPKLGPPSSFPLNFGFGIDGRLLAYAALSMLATLAIFAFAPLAYATRVPLLEAISGARTAGRSARPALRYALVATQVALSVVLVTGAVTLGRALGEAREIYPGYDTSRPLALAWISGDERGFAASAERAAATPGVESITYARHLPLVGSGAGAKTPVIPEGAPADAPPRTIYYNLVGPNFFEVTGARLVSGRAFGAGDHHGGAPVAIVNAEAARRFWPGADPLGRTLTVEKERYEVVGIAADGRIGGLHEQVAPALFLPAGRMRAGEAIIIARTRTDPAEIVRAMGRAAAGVNGIRVYQTMTLRTLLESALYGDWMLTVAGGGLALIGLLLAGGGLYGAVSYVTERRVSEFGVRLALGARSAQVAGLVLRQASALCVIGVPAGCVLFALLYRTQAKVLFSGRPMSVIDVAAGCAITIAVVLAGALAPAMRAARLDPMAALRAD